MMVIVFNVAANLMFSHYESPCCIFQRFYFSPVLFARIWRKIKWCVGRDAVHMNVANTALLETHGYAINLSAHTIHVIITNNKMCFIDQMLLQ